VSAERTQLVELRPARVNRMLRRRALGDGPELAEVGSAVIPGRRTSRPNGLFVADGGSQCPDDPCSAAGLLCRAGRPDVLLPVEVCPGFPWGSLVFLSCSFGASAGGLEWNAGHRSAAFAQVRDLRRWSG